MYHTQNESASEIGKNRKQLRQTTLFAGKPRKIFCFDSGNGLTEKKRVAILKAWLSAKLILQSDLTMQERFDILVVRLSAKLANRRTERTTAISKIKGGKIGEYQKASCDCTCNRHDTLAHCVQSKRACARSGGSSRDGTRRRAGTRGRCPDRVSLGQF